MAAVQIHGTRGVAIIQPDSIAGVSVLFVVVVANVPHPRLGRVPTVRRHRRPAELERQKDEQDDGKDAAHG